jgi:hypothetical protein
MKKYRITPTYSLLSLLGAGFIIISYIANIISLYLRNNQYHGEAEHHVLLAIN